MKRIDWRLKGLAAFLGLLDDGLCRELARTGERAKKKATVELPPAVAQGSQGKRAQR